MNNHDTSEKIPFCFPSDFSLNRSGLDSKLVLFQIIEDNITDVVTILDLDFKRLYVSPSILSQRGFTVEEAMDIPLKDTMSAKSFQAVLKTLNGVLEYLNQQSATTPIHRHLELELFKKDGSTIWADVHVQLHLDHNGNPEYIVALSRDISRQKLTLKALKSSEERYRKLFTDTLEALSLVKDGKVFDANNEWLRLHGYDNRAEVIGTPILGFIHPSQHEFMMARQYRDFKPNEARCFEVLDLKKDRSTVYVEVKSTTINFSGQRYTLSAVRDITQQHRSKLQIDNAIRALREKSEELERANAELSRYAHAVSHELKAPARNIYSLTSFLESELNQKTPNKITDYLEKIKNASVNLRNTIESMLELSRVSESNYKLKPIHLKTIIPNVFRRIQYLDGEVELPMEWPTVQGQPFLLIQVIANLVTNGFKFNKSPRKQVWISWKKVTRKHIEIIIRDNGIGIEEKYFDLIFENFKRLHSQDEFDGTGIGLSIVKRAVELMKGKIRIESQPGSGTTFFIQLRRAD